MRKQSFYVWFLGAQEARAVGDERSVRPALKYLLEREKDLEPTKVTLQVSSKGLKIVQNILRCGSPKTAKKEQTKHLIPPHSLTHVIQADPPHEDVVCCTLLIYNPVTKCPVHVHAYRCDSVETACSLRYQLAQLMEHGLKTIDQNPVDSEIVGFSPPLPEGGHMRPMRAPNGAIRKLQPPIGSDGRSTRTDEEDPEFEADVDDYEIGKSIYDGVHSSPFGGPMETLRREACEITAPQDPQMVRLYDSLAQELKAKLANGLKCKTQKTPLLLPPKDYDTVCRKQGNLMLIDSRRSTNQNIVGRPNSTTTNNSEDAPTRRKDFFASDLLASNSGKSSPAKGDRPSRIDDRIHDDDADDWRPTGRHDVRLRHRSLDFVQQRLDQFHMAEQKRTTPERYQAAAANLKTSQSNDRAKTTYFVHPMQRSLSNPIDPQLEPPQTVPRLSPKDERPHHQERPISFPSGGWLPRREFNPQSRLSPPQCFSFHQHPVKESMIEPIINNHRQQRRRSSPGSRFEAFLHHPSRMQPDANIPAENMKPHSSRQMDYRRQSLAEFGPHRDPAKYLLNSPLERRAFRNRYSVAESSGQRLY